jgi:hypothetical protein
MIRIFIILIVLLPSLCFGAIDSRNKRASIINIAEPSGRVYPNPDGTIDANDRQQTAYSYSSITIYNELLTLSAMAQLTEIASGDLQTGLPLLTAAQFQGMGNVDIAVNLALSAVASLQESNTITAQSALLLSNVIATTPLPSVDYDTLLTLATVAAYLAEVPAGGGTSYDVYLTLSTIVQFVGQGKLDAATNLNLPLLSTYQTSIISIISAALTLSNAVSYLPQGMIDWSTILTIASQVTYGGLGGYAFSTDITLATSTTLTTALSSVIQEGILVLTTQSQYDTAAQLAAYGGLLLQQVADMDLSVNRDIDVALILEAITTAVMYGEMELLEWILGTEVPARLFLQTAPARTFGTEVPARRK